MNRRHFLFFSAAALLAGGKRSACGLACLPAAADRTAPSAYRHAAR